MSESHKPPSKRNSEHYRQFVVDHFGVSANENLVQLSLSFEGVDVGGSECIIREATAVMPLRSIKVLQILLTNVLNKLETDLGPITLPPGKEEELRKALGAKKA